jgi:hypothetical protein
MMQHALRTSLLALVAVSFGAPAALAESQTEEYTHSDAKLDFQLPKSWKVDAGDDLLTAENPAGDLGMIFFVAGEKDAEKFFTAIAEELDKFIKSPEITKGPTESKVNGLVQVYIEGTGRADGEAIDFDLTYIVGGAKPMVAVALGKIDANQQTINKVYRSISPSR